MRPQVLTTAVVALSWAPAASAQVSAIPTAKPTTLGKGTAPVLAPVRPSEVTGSHIPVKPRTLKSEEAGRIQRGVSRCLYKRRPAVADVYIRTSDPVVAVPPATGDVAKTFPLAECLGANVSVEGDVGQRFSAVLLRSYLQEGEYLTLVKTLPDQTAATRAPRVFVSTGDDLKRARAIGEFADCAVDTDAVSADRFVRSTRGSEEEKQIARLLAPTLGKCLVEGQTVSLRLSNLRTILIDGLWQRFLASRPAGDAAGDKSAATAVTGKN